MAADTTVARVQRVYYATGALFTLSASVIWGVNTLFLLDTGLNLFQVMVVNAMFSVGQIVFEIPTGVIADTIGRRASFLIGIAALVLATVGYVLSAVFAWGLGGLVVASVLLGFGFTCQTGAVDAWLVDALDAVGFSGKKDRVFARGGVFNGVSMVVGVLGGGLLGQLHLTFPYYARGGLLLAAFALTAVFMRDIGFQPRALKLSRFGIESRNILTAGIAHGWRHRVVRPLLFVSAIQGFLLWYLFYASQPYALELLGKENLVWVAGAITALFALSGVAGNALVGPISRTRFSTRPATVLWMVTGASALMAIGLGVTGLLAPTGGHLAAFVIVAVLLCVFGILSGVAGPIRQAYINDHIPSAQRATVLSFDSFFGDVGAVGGQLGLGGLAQSTSKALAYAVGGAVYLLAVPLYRIAGRASTKKVDLQECLDGQTVSPACADIPGGTQAQPPGLTTPQKD